MTGDIAAPTLRCPNCGSTDLHFTSGEVVRCSRCLKKWSREELRTGAGTPGHHSDKKGRGR
jgi:transposase-like protein